MAIQTRSDGKTHHYKMASGATLTALRFIKLASDTTITQITAATDLAIGVLLSSTSREDVEVPVQLDGPCDVEVGGTVTRGQMVKIDSSGRVVNSTFATTEIVVGQAMESKTTSGQIAKIKLLSAVIDVP